MIDIDDKLSISEFMGFVFLGGVIIGALLTYVVVTH